MLTLAVTSLYVDLIPLPNRSCLETTVRTSNTVNTAAATSTQIVLETIQMPACTQIRGTTTTLMQSSIVDQSRAIKTRTKMTRIWATGQTGEARLAAGSLERVVLALTGAACVRTEGTCFKIYMDVIHIRASFIYHLPIKISVNIVD